MIATIRFHLFGQPARAVLSDGLVWSTPDLDVSRALNSLLQTEATSPSRGYWIDQHVVRVGRTLGGTILFAPLKSPKGRIY
jgi:hypothetical protein